MTKAVETTARRDAERFGVDLEEWNGRTWGDVLSEFEHSGATVYWGCWTQAQLDEVLHFDDDRGALNILAAAYDEIGASELLSINWRARCVLSSAMHHVENASNSPAISDRRVGFSTVDDLESAIRRST